LSLFQINSNNTAPFFFVPYRCREGSIKQFPLAIIFHRCKDFPPESELPPLDPCTTDPLASIPITPPETGSLPSCVEDSSNLDLSPLPIHPPPSSLIRLHSHSSTSLDSEASLQVLPGYREAEEDEAYLSDLLNSSSSRPFIPGNSSQLPIFRGKELIDPSSKTDTSNTLLTDKDRKDFAWSRGLGTELSPLQTRSSRKKKEISSIQPKVTVIPPMDGKALRALKALARSK
jgi:hypothetical protein